jgi:hypothetical protein
MRMGSMYKEAAMKLDPALSTSHTPIRVRFCETDLMGIVHHANYLAYFEEGRVDWLRKRDLTYAAWAHRGVHRAIALLSRSTTSSISRHASPSSSHTRCATITAP